MSWVLAAVLSVLLVETVSRLSPGALFERMISVARKAQHTLRSSAISDHWKEKVILRYAISLFAGTTWLSGLLLALAGGIVLLAAGLDQLGLEMSGFLLSLKGAVFSTAVAITYLHVRSRLA